MYLFVYGTLQSFNSRKMQRLGFKFVGKVRTKEKFSLHVDDLIPFLHDDEKKYHVYGELYEIDLDKESGREALEILDQYEIEGQWYHRKPLVVVLDENLDQEYEAEAYFCNNGGLLLSHGKYEDYALHNKK